MANKLYFRYGTMGSSKSAQALMVKFNYEQKGMKVLLVKPSIDKRWDNETPQVRSRIGLASDCHTITPEDSLIALYQEVLHKDGCDCIILDEVNFCTTQQIDELKEISKDIPVLCYGLLVDFRCELFDGSKRLIEIADSLQEIKSICRCGKKSTVNARFINGVVVDEGPKVFLGGDESYEGMCYWCWKKELEKAKKKEC